MLVYPNLFMVDPRGLNHIYQEIMDKQKADQTKLLWPHWKNKILEAWRWA